MNARLQCRNNDSRCRHERPVGNLSQKNPKNSVEMLCNSSMILQEKKKKGSSTECTNKWGTKSCWARAHRRDKTFDWQRFGGGAILFLPGCVQIFNSIVFVTLFAFCRSSPFALCVFPHPPWCMSRTQPSKPFHSCVFHMSWKWNAAQRNGVRKDVTRQAEGRERYTG